MSSAPGPLLLGTSEHPSSNGPLSMDHENISESLILSSTLGNVSSQQSILSRGGFKIDNMNGVGYSQTEQISVEHAECEEATDVGNAVNKSFTTVGNELMEVREHETSGKQTEQSNNSGRESRDAQKDRSHSAATNIDNQTSGTQFIASSSNTIRAQLPNHETSITNTSQTTSSETLRREDVASSPQQEKMHDFNKPLGMSEAKRRRIEDENSNVPNETQVKDNKSASTPNKDYLTESIEENKTITIEVSKEALLNNIHLLFLYLCSSKCSVTHF